MACAQTSLRRPTRLAIMPISLVIRSLTQPPAWSLRTKFLSHKDKLAFGPRITLRKYTTVLWICISRRRERRGQEMAVWAAWVMDRAKVLADLIFNSLVTS